MHLAPTKDTPYFTQLCRYLHFGWFSLLTKMSTLKIACDKFMQLILILNRMDGTCMFYWESSGILLSVLSKYASGI